MANQDVDVTHSGFQSAPRLNHAKSIVGCESLLNHGMGLAHDFFVEGLRVMFTTSCDEDKEENDKNGEDDSGDWGKYSNFGQFAAICSRT